MIYLDYAATHPMPEGVREAYTEALGLVGNPSSIHQGGQASRAMLEQARLDIASLIGADPMEVTFTSGGTESTNTWLKGRVFAHRKILGTDTPCYIVLTRAEHHATLDALEWLESNNLASPLWVEVDSDGVIDLEDLQRALRSTDTSQIAGITSLVANNEVGSIQPVGEIVEVAGHHGGIPVHLDAVQAFGHLPLNIHELGVDAITLSAHKVGGPVGIGALVQRRSAAPIEPILHGGNQQPARSGTLDAAGASAFAAAASGAMSNLEAENERVSVLRDRLMDGLSSLPGVQVRGSVFSRLPNNVHITMEGVSGEVVLYLLDQAGICVSTGSACQAGVAEASHVLLAMGCSQAEASSALRFSLGGSTTEEDISKVLEVFPGFYEQAKKAG